MMRRLILMCISLLMAGLFTLPALAYPPCGPYNRPNDDGTQFCRPAYMISNETVTIAKSVPFAWLRETPSSTAKPLATVHPGTTLRMHSPANTPPQSHWDGYQWWWQVKDVNKGTIGWVEQASLIYLVTNPTPPAEPTEDTSITRLATWSAPVQAQIESGISYVWLRAAPNEGIVATIRAAQRFTLLSSPAPQFDGYQWWWAAELTSSQGTQMGWIEQGSVQPLQ